MQGGAAAALRWPAGATAIPPRPRPGVKACHPPQGANRTARRSCTTASRARVRHSPTRISTICVHVCGPDGTPTYMHAVVVDDHDMGVTHIIRGVDHLTNAARQTQIYRAMGWTVPGHVAHPADPWRRTVPSCPSAMARWASKPYRAHGLPAGSAAQLPGAAWLEPWRPTRCMSTKEMIDCVRSSATSAVRRPASTSPSSRRSTAHYMRGTADAERLFEAICIATPAPSRGWRRQSPRALAPRGSRAQVLAALPGPEGARQDTWSSVVDGAGFLLARRPLPTGRQGGPALLSMTMPARCLRGAHCISV